MSRTPLVLTVGLLLAFGGPVAAYAANDALCGTTITADLALTQDVDCTGYTGYALTIGASGVTLEGNGYRILAPDSSRAISSVGFDDVTVQNVEVVGWCSGIGVYLSDGTGLTVDNVVADARSYGVQVVRGANVLLRDITADSAAAAGLLIEEPVDVPVLEGLRLTNSLVGLELQTSSLTFTLAPQHFASLAGSDTNIKLTSVSNLTLDGLTLGGSTAGVAATVGNHDLTLINLDVTATSTSGTGIDLAGDGHFIQNVDANRRTYGVHLASGSGLTVRDLRAVGATTAGLYLEGVDTPLTLEQLSLENCAAGLKLEGLAPASPFTINPWPQLDGTGVIASLADSDTGVDVDSSSNLLFVDLTLDNPSYGIDAQGVGSSDLVFRDLDLSGPNTGGTGLIVRGAGHLVEDVIADGRTTGVYFYYASNATARRVLANNTGTGLYLANITGSLLLEQLRLTNCTLGLYINGFAGDPTNEYTIQPWTASTGGAIADLGGSLTGIQLVDAHHMTLDGLTLDNPANGILATNASNSDLTFVNLDLSGPGRGNGIYLAGDRHRVDNVTADHRAEGGWFNATSDLSLIDFRARDGGDGVYFTNLAADDLAPHLERLTLTRNNRGFRTNVWLLAFVFQPSLAIDVSASRTGYYLDYTSNVSFVGLTLDNPAAGIYANYGNSNLTFSGVDVSGHGAGFGIKVGYAAGATAYQWGGTGHVLTNVTANRRQYGVQLVRASGVAITSLVARHNSGAGLVIFGYHPGDAPPALSGLDLRDNSEALRLQYWDLPHTIDAGVGLDALGSGTGVYIDYSSDLTLSGLTLDTREYGIKLGYDTARLRFEGLTVSGHGAGYGIFLGTVNSTPLPLTNAGCTTCVIKDVVADRRAVGVYGYRTSALSVEHLTARHGGTGLSLHGFATSWTPPTLKRLDLSDNAVGLQLDYIDAPSGAPLTLAPWDGTVGAIASLAGCGTSLAITHSSRIVVDGLTLDGAAYGVDADTGNSLLTLGDLDVSGTRRGLGDGVVVSGAGHVIEGVSGARRNRVVVAEGVSALRVANLTAATATIGLDIDGVTPPLDLEALSLTDCGTGLLLEDYVGAPATPLIIAAPTVALPTAAIATLGANDRDLHLLRATHVTVQDLALHGRSYGLYADGAAATTGLIFRRLDVSGVGVGTGLYLNSTTGTLIEGVGGDRRDFGISLASTVTPTLRDVTFARADTDAVSLVSTTLPVTLDNLALSDSFCGLHVNAVVGAGALALGPTQLSDLAGDATAVWVQGAGTVNVDTAGLGLTGTGTYTAPLPPSDPDCGMVLDGAAPLGPALTLVGGTYTLTDDLDCSGVTTTALSVGADGVHLDGAGFRVVAPFAATVIDVGAYGGVTIEGVDVSGRYAAGTGVAVGVGAGNTVRDVTASVRAVGVDVSGTSVTPVVGLTVSGLTADQTETTALALDHFALPLTLTGLHLTDGEGVGLHLANGSGLDGGTGDSLTLGAATLADLRGNATSLDLASVDHLAFTGSAHPLDGTTAGIAAATTTNSDLRFEGLDLSGAGAGTGLALRGDRHAVVAVVADDRATGLDLQAAGALTLSAPHADGASVVGISLTGLTAPSTLSGLAAPNSAIGVALVDYPGTLATPLTLNPTAIATVAGSATGVRLAGDAFVTVTGLTLSNPTWGIDATPAGNTDLTFSALDVSGTRGVGTGLGVSGARLLVSDVLANDRATGVSTTSASASTLSDVRASRATAAGLSLGGADPTVTLTQLRLTHGVIGLSVSGFAGDALNPFAIDPWTAVDGGVVTDLTGCDTSISITSSTDMRVVDLTLDGPVAGLSASHVDNARLTFSGLDLPGRWPDGSGIILNGDTLVAEDLDISDRRYGVNAAAATNLTLRDIRSSRAATAAVYLSGTVAPFHLEQLRATDSVVGIYLNAVDGASGDPAADTVIGPWSSGAGGVVADLSGSDAGIRLTTTSHVTVRDLTLSNWDYGVLAQSAGNHDLTLTGLNVSGTSGYGTGLAIEGSDIAASTIVADRRGAGVALTRTDNVSVTNLTSRWGNIGLHLQYNTAAHRNPQLSGLTLTDNAKALYFAFWSAPFTVGPSLALNAARSDRGIEFTQTSSNVTVNGLTLDNPGAGIYARSQSNLTFTNLNLSGPRAGTGLDISGNGHVVTGVTADDRHRGLILLGGSDVRVTNLTARRCNAGIYLQDFTPAHSGLVLDGLTLTDGVYGIEFYRCNMPFTVNAATRLDASGALTGIWATLNSEQLVFDGLTLDNPVAGIAATGSNRALTFTNLDVSGSGRGRGLDVTGDGDVIASVTANNRDYGVYVTGAAGIDVDGVTASGANQAALYLSGADGASLANLSLTNNNRGFELNDTVGPMLIDPTPFTAFTGNLTPITITRSTDLTVADFTLPSVTSGVDGSNRYNERLHFMDLDVTGYCRGDGLGIGGEDILAERVVAGRRGNAIVADRGDLLLVRDSVMGASTVGLSGSSNSLMLYSTVKAGANTKTYLLVVAYIANGANLYPGEVVRVYLPEPYGPVDRVVAATYGYSITLTEALPIIPPVGTVVREADYGVTRLKVERSDFCANATGASVTTRPLVATGDYWRSANGPTHASVPGGDGDTVTATGDVDLSGFVAVPTDKANPYCNQAPLPDAGSAQTVCEGDTVTLDATGSSDPDIEPLTFAWQQLTGASATVSAGDTATPSFVAPTPGAVPSEVLTFEVKVADDQIERTATVGVTVEQGNPPPVAAAGDDQSVGEGAAVALDAGGSSDPDGLALSYLWTQTGGPAVTLSGATSATPSFTAPTLGPSGDPALSATLTFTATVTDIEPAGYCGGAKSRADAVQVIVNNVDTAPVAVLGADQNVVEGALVTLAAGASSDADGDTLGFAWTQTGGPAVILTGAATAAPTFTAPEQAQLTTAALSFAVTVSDGFGGTAQGSVTIAVNDACVGADADGDGVFDCVDGCPADPDKVAVGACGCGFPETDTDGDGIPDCVEDCSTEVDGTVVADTVACGSGACGNTTGAITCQGGVAVNSCDPAYGEVPDDVCTPVGLIITYAVVSDASGAPRGTIRCARDPAGDVRCDESAPGTLRVYDGLFCPGVTP